MNFFGQNEEKNVFFESKEKQSDHLIGRLHHHWQERKKESVVGILSSAVQSNSYCAAESLNHPQCDQMTKLFESMWLSTTMKNCPIA